MSIRARDTSRGRAYDVRYRGPDGREISRTFLAKRDALEFEAQAATEQLALAIAINSPLVTQGVKKAMVVAEGRTVDDALDYVAQWNSSFLISNDLMEATTPSWRNATTRSRASERARPSPEARSTHLFPNPVDPDAIAS